MRHSWIAASHKDLHQACASLVTKSEFFAILLAVMYLGALHEAR